MAVGRKFYVLRSLLVIVLLFLKLNSKSVSSDLSITKANIFYAGKLSSTPNFDGFGSRSKRLKSKPTPLSSSFKSWFLLFKQARVAMHLLYLSGDLEINPGPVEDPCRICSKGCRSNQRAIQCDSCDQINERSKVTAAITGFMRNALIRLLTIILNFLTLILARIAHTADPMMFHLL